MENFEKMKNMDKKQKISRQTVPVKIINEHRSKSLICIVDFGTDKDIQLTQL